MNPNNVPLEPQQRPNNEIFRDDPEPNGPLGPIELSILERVENGLIYTDEEPSSAENKSERSEQVKNKYTGPKEIIFVSGWININSVYQRYFWGFISKIMIGKQIHSSPPNGYFAVFDERYVFTPKEAKDIIILCKSVDWDILKSAKMRYMLTYI